MKTELIISKVRVTPRFALDIPIKLQEDTVPNFVRKKYHHSKPISDRITIWYKALICQNG